MLIAIEYTIQALQAIVQDLPIGTNFALLQLMWVMLQGRLLSSRGGIFPALLAHDFVLQVPIRDEATDVG